MAVRITPGFARRERGEMRETDEIRQRATEKESTT
jgi:hypothetical protein